MAYISQLYSFIFVLTSFLSVFGIETDLTIYVNAREVSCFYQYIEKGTAFEVEYQVVDGGDLDINFSVRTPSGRIMVNEYRKNDGEHKLDGIEAGDYKLCLDNAFSRFSEKVVYIEIITDTADPNWDKLSDFGYDYDYDVASVFELTLEEIKSSFDTVRGHLDKSIQTQRMLRAIEARDRSVAEDNFIRVNFWAPVQLVIMILVALSQVYFIRQLFGDSSSVTQKGLKVQT